MCIRDSSYTEAYDALKKQLNRRRFNKSGQLPALEAELAEVQQQLDSSVQLQQQLADALERSQALESDVQTLSDELAQYDRWEEMCIRDSYIILSFAPFVKTLFKW